VIVVDTNILVYRWLPSPHDTDADALIRIDPVWASPRLWRSEFRNVALHYVRRGLVQLIEAETATSRAEKSLLGGEHIVSDHDVFSLADRSKCTAYDCEFVALAQRLRTKLITDDKALLRAFPQICLSLVHTVRGTKP
jgi:predicted nucleic acid-binding protein